mgnify:CR=1 FL=1
MFDASSWNRLENNAATPGWLASTGAADRLSDRIKELRARAERLPDGDERDVAELVEELVFAGFRTRWWVTADRTHLVGDVAAGSLTEAIERDLSDPDGVRSAVAEAEGLAYAHVPVISKGVLRPTCQFTLRRVEC